MIQRLRPVIPAALCLAGLLEGLTGCTRGLDDLEQPYDLLLDYTLDRPRVMGLSVWPPLYGGGTTLRLEALAATPDQLEGARIEWWGCGVTLPEPVQGVGSDCYGTDLAEYLGAGASFSLTLPAYDLASCQAEYSCYSSMPLFAVVRSPDSSQADGYAVDYLVPDLTGMGVAPENDLPTAPITFQVGSGAPISYTSNAPVLEPSPVLATGTAAPGGEVPLELRVETRTDYDYLFTWYTSAGELEQFGLTRADPLEPGQSGQPNIVHGRNTLRVPEDFEGSSIRVWVVIDVVTVVGEGDYFGAFLPERFMAGRVEVSR